MLGRMKAVWRRARDYVKYDLREIIAPSSIPDPPETEKIPKLTWQEYRKAVREGWQDYLDSWRTRPQEKNAKEGASPQGDAKKGEGEKEEPSIAEELAVAARGGAKALRPALQKLYVTRAQHLRDAVSGFVEGYREGIIEVEAGEGQQKHRAQDPSSVVTKQGVCATSQQEERVQRGHDVPGQKEAAELKFSSKHHGSSLSEDKPPGKGVGPVYSSPSADTAEFQQLQNSKDQGSDPGSSLGADIPPGKVVGPVYTPSAADTSGLLHFNNSQAQNHSVVKPVCGAQGDGPQSHSLGGVSQSALLDSDPVPASIESTAARLVNETPLGSSLTMQSSEITGCQHHSQLETSKDSSISKQKRETKMFETTEEAVDMAVDGHGVADMAIQQKSETLADEEGEIVTSNQDQTRRIPSKQKLLGWTVWELRTLCKVEGITGYSRMRKKDLVDVIVKHKPSK